MPQGAPIPDGGMLPDPAAHYDYPWIIYRVKYRPPG
jgi:hypothetical protein